MGNCQNWNTRIGLAILAAAVFVACTAGRVVETTTQVGLDIKATILEDQPGEFVLSFELANLGETEIRIPRTALWRNLVSLAVVEVSTGAILPEERDFFDGMPAGAWTLGPGETGEGEIYLYLFFPELRKVLARTPVLVFWSVLIPLDDGEPSMRFGGYIEVR